MSYGRRYYGREDGTIQTGDALMAIFGFKRVAVIRDGVTYPATFEKPDDADRAGAVQPARPTADA